jgi:hypothetical protein
LCGAGAGSGDVGPADEEEVDEESFLHLSIARRCWDAEEDFRIKFIEPDGEIIVLLPV